LVLSTVPRGALTAILSADIMAGTLVVYYSRTGITKRAATEIASALGADIEEISDFARRSGWIGYLRSAFEGAFQRATEIDNVAHDLKSYDLVVLGTPIWNASLSSPVRAFIRQNRSCLKAVAFFCTYGSWGGARALQQMTFECGKLPAAGLSLHKEDVSRGSTPIAIHEFVSRIRRELSTRGSSKPPFAAHEPIDNVCLALPRDEKHPGEAPSR
jgi:flavodoxin